MLHGQPAGTASALQFRLTPALGSPGRLTSLQSHKSVFVWGGMISTRREKGLSSHRARAVVLGAVLASVVIK